MIIAKIKYGTKNDMLSLNDFNHKETTECIYYLFDISRHVYILVQLIQNVPVKWNNYQSFNCFDRINSISVSSGN